MASPTIQHTTPEGKTVTVFGELDARQREVLSEAALNFLGHLHTKQNPRRLELLAARQDARAKVAAGEQLAFEASPRSIREDDSWRGAPLAAGPNDRGGQITGRVDRRRTMNPWQCCGRCCQAAFDGRS